MCAKTRQKVFKFEINEIVDISTWGLKTVLMENNIDYSHQIITRGVFQHIIEQNVATTPTGKRIFFGGFRQGKMLQIVTGVGITMGTEVKCWPNQFRGADVTITPK